MGAGPYALNASDRDHVPRSVDAISPCVQKDQLWDMFEQCLRDVVRVRANYDKFLSDCLRTLSPGEGEEALQHLFMVTMMKGAPSSMPTDLGSIQKIATVFQLLMEPLSTAALYANGALEVIGGNPDAVVPAP